MNRIVSGLLAGLVSAGASAQVAITEVAPWSSGNSAVNADWFEVTNLGASAIDVTAWRMDDSSATFASSVALRGVSSIAAGRSVILIESNASGSNDAALAGGFLGTWFGGAAPAGLQIGFYGGSGVGLSTGGDGVTLFDAAGTLISSIAFGASPDAAPFASFDNAVGLGNASISQLSVAGINGAFLAAGGNEIGSPGASAPVPEPETYALLLVGLGLVGVAARKRRR